MNHQSPPSVTSRRVSAPLWRLSPQGRSGAIARRQLIETQRLILFVLQERVFRAEEIRLANLPPLLYGVWMIGSGEHRGWRRLAKEQPHHRCWPRAHVESLCRL